MKKRWLVRLTAALLCLAVCLSAAWVWSSLSGFQFEAGARISLAGDPFSSNDDGAHRSGSPIEDRILNPDVVSAAAGLLADRGIHLSLESPFDSVTDFLLDHTHVIVPDGGDVDDVRIFCRADNADEAVQMVTALVDACLAATKSSETEPPASRSDDTVAERRQLADAIVRQQQSIEEMDARLQDMKSAGQPQDDPVVLETELVSARRTGSEAQQRLAEGRRDFETQVAADLVAARIVSIPVRTRTLERLNLLKLQDELARQESQRQKWSAIYGRNHPKMVEIRQKIDSLQQEVAGAASSANPDEVAGGEISPASIVLKALEAEAAEFATVERNLQTRRDAVLARLATQQELETRLAETRQELAFLHGEHDRLKRQIDNSRHDLQRSIPKMIEPPSITTGRNGPRTGLPMAVACVAGMLLCLLILWQFRRAPAVAQRAIASVPTVTLKPVSAPRRERFRSPAEEQLMRLKMLSVHADADR